MVPNVKTNSFVDIELANLKPTLPKQPQLMVPAIDYKALELQIAKAKQIMKVNTEATRVTNSIISRSNKLSKKIIA